MNEINENSREEESARRPVAEVDGHAVGTDEADAKVASDDPLANMNGNPGDAED